MKIIGLTRVRNEAEIMQDTLDHLSTYCDLVCVYDDCSTDQTQQICRQHPIVEELIVGSTWGNNRLVEEYKNRQTVLEAGKKYASDQDWFVYVDADERLEYNFNKLKHYPADVIGVKMKLFDFYITEKDKHLNYKYRRFLGPEFRIILMAFRNLPSLLYHKLDQREVSLRNEGKIVVDGFVKHYGKSISVQQWEDTCDYYSKHFPQYSEKWRNRKGKAIHTKSDFGRELITWDQKEEKGIHL